MENSIGNETERFGKRAAEKIGDAAQVAGQKLDSAVDYVESTTHNAKQSIDQIRRDGWNGIKEKALEYTRTEPFNALMIAAATGLLLGWLTKRSGR